MFPILFLAIATTLAACAHGPSSGSGQSVATSHPAGETPALEKGMTAAEVKQLLGPPEQVKQVDSGDSTGVKAEVWTYRRTMDRTDLQATSTQEVPYFDPITGAERTIQEPVYSHVRHVVIITTELLMIEDRLSEWKQSRREERSYN